MGRKAGSRKTIRVHDASKPRVKITKEPFRFYYRADGVNSGDGDYRWWRSDWFGDQFDIIGPEELKKRMDGAKMCGILVTELGDNEEPEDRP